MIATPPNNSVILKMIDYIIFHSPPKNYMEYVDATKLAIESSYYTKATAGVLENTHGALVIRAEKCSLQECKHTIKQKPDRYQTCCNIYDKTVQNIPIITVRDADYPWTDNPWTGIWLRLHPYYFNFFDLIPALFYSVLLFMIFMLIRRYHSSHRRTYRIVVRDTV